MTSYFSKLLPQWENLVSSILVTNSEQIYIDDCCRYLSIIKQRGQLISENREIRFNFEIKRALIGLQFHRKMMNHKICGWKNRFALMKLFLNNIRIID